MAGILEEELVYEESNYEEPKQAKQGPPEPFQLKEEEAGSTFELTRGFAAGGEAITVKVDMLSATEEQEEEQVAAVMEHKSDEVEGREATPRVPFTATVDKAVERLVFECATEGAEVEVRRVTHEEDGQDEMIESPNGGVSYHELDPKLQEAFSRYLHVRGLDASLCQYIAEKFDDKEQRDYMRFLRKSRHFVSSGE